MSASVTSRWGRIGLSSFVTAPTPLLSRTPCCGRQPPLAPRALRVGFNRLPSVRRGFQPRSRPSLPTCTEENPGSLPREGGLEDGAVVGCRDRAGVVRGAAVLFAGLRQ